jgi:hypothetical protein
MILKVNMGVFLQRITEPSSHPYVNYLDTITLINIDLGQP